MKFNLFTLMTLFFVGCLLMILNQYNQKSYKYRNDCIRKGCNNDICTDRNNIDTVCLFNQCRSNCYKNYTVCKRINHRCMFQLRTEFNDCLERCE